MTYRKVRAVGIRRESRRHSRRSHRPDQTQSGRRRLHSTRLPGEIRRKPPARPGSNSIAVARPLAPAMCAGSPCSSRPGADVHDMLAAAAPEPPVPKRMGRRAVRRGHGLMENRNGLIVGAVTTTASGHAERGAALALIEPTPTPAPVTLAPIRNYDSADLSTALRGQWVNRTWRRTRTAAARAIDNHTASHPAMHIRNIPEASRRGLGLGQDGGRLAQDATSRMLEVDWRFAWRWLPMTWFACPNCLRWLRHQDANIKQSGSVALAAVPCTAQPAVTSMPIIAKWMRCRVESCRMAAT